MDLLLDAVTHDIVWNNGPLTAAYVTHPYVQKVSQRLKIRLLTFQGEYFWDTTYGVPWWQKILGFKISKGSLDLLLQQQILLEDGVKEIISFTSTFKNRKYSLTFSVRCVNGETSAPITINPVN